MTLSVLHLSDIHIKTKDDPILSKSEHIAKTLYSELSQAEGVLILISGDIAFSGTQQQYVFAEKFLKEIEAAIRLERDIPIYYVFCPGNHDCDFSPNTTREYIIDNLQKDDIETVDQKVLNDCTSHQKEYFNFANKFEKNRIQEDSLWVTHSIEINNKTILLESLNLAWMSKIHEEQGHLQFPFEKYTAKSENNNSIRISVMHHPLNWLSQRSYRNFRSCLRSISDIIVTGHEHYGNTIEHDDDESGKTLIIEAGSLQDGECLEGSSFGIINLSIDSDKSLHKEFLFDSDNDLYQEKCKKTIETHDKLNTKSFTFKRDFKEKIEDSGGYFVHNNVQNLRLPDIFIYPDIRGNNRVGDSESSISSKTLLHLDNFSSGIILSGEEKIGSTSLIYILISEFRSANLFPVLINGNKIKDKNPHNIKIQIERALLEQYDDKNIITKFSQEPKKNKILFIDDFHDIKIHSEDARNAALKYLLTKFEKIIITVGSMFDAGELTNSDEECVIKSFDNYKIEAFGYKKRTELIRKWYSLDRKDHECDALIDQKCEIAERLIDNVMDKSLISPHPIYFLTFLQSIQAGESEQLTDSALGDYYSFLLTRGFIESGVQQDALSIELDYVMHLARYFSEKNASIISKFEFKEFNDEFSRTWHESDFNKKEKTLIDAKVLIKNEDDYEFRYQYNYFYLLGKYLSRNITKPEIKIEIANYIKHLYVKKYANTILFLAHHTTSDNILLLMKDAADSIFEECPPTDFNGGCSVINEIIQHAPTLVYKKKEPHQVRSQLSERKDIREKKNPEIVINKEEKSPDDISVGVKLSMLFKTIEILSQIIKSNPSKFQRGQKVDVIKSVFNAPLRALQFFYDFWEDSPDTLIDVIQYDLSKKSKSLTTTEREAIARQAVSRLIQGASTSFIVKTAQITNSTVLQYDIPTAVKQNETLAFQLIELSISIDNHKPIPRAKISNIYAKSEKNIIARKILEMIIYNRLYMFKPIESDMQWLESNLKFNIDRQHKIAYKPNIKKLKIER